MLNIKKAVSFVMWSSPLLKLFFNTTDAVSDGYDERLIDDPGHKRIKIFDKLVISLTWITAGLIVFRTVNHYGNLNDLMLGDLYTIWALIKIILFPYFSNIYVSVLLYVNTIILSIYNKNRQNIIRAVNEKSGTW